MKKIFAALVPLSLSACAPPSVLTGSETLALESATAPAAQSVSATATLFANFQPRPVTQAGDWRALNRAQAPAGALE